MRLSQVVDMAGHSPFTPMASPLCGRFNGLVERSGFMPLTRAKAVGYDADLMVFKFTMRNGDQIVQCEISNAALGNLVGGAGSGM